jgi:hypothetical protein
MEVSGSMGDGRGDYEDWKPAQWTDWGKQVSDSIKRRWTGDGVQHIDFRCGCRTASSDIVHNWYKCCAGHRDDLRAVRREIREQKEKQQELK